MDVYSQNHFCSNTRTHQAHAYTKHRLIPHTQIVRIHTYTHRTHTYTAHTHTTHTQQTPIPHTHKRTHTTHAQQTPPYISHLHSVWVSMNKDLSHTIFMSLSYYGLFIVVCLAECLFYSCCFSSMFACVTDDGLMVFVYYILVGSNSIELF